MDLSNLTPVLTAEGPFVTVHVGAESAVEQAADRYELVWKDAIKQLEEENLPGEVSEAVSAARGDHADGEARLVVATVSDATVRLSAPVSAVPERGATVHVGPLPRLLPLVADLTQRVPFVLIRADRAGADISAFFDPDKLAREVTVKGETLHIQKVRVGGWAHRHYQQRSANVWKENAGEARETAIELAEQIGAELLVCAGEERAVQLIKEGLPQPWDERWREISGGRAADGSTERVMQDARDVVALHVARQTLELLREFAQERGQLDRACEGIPDVVQALRKAQVETLLLTTELTRLDHDGVDVPTLFFSNEPTAIGTTREEVASLGAQRIEEAPAVDVLIRAAIATGADVQVVPHEAEISPNAPVGAVLRYSDDDNAAARA